MCALPFDLEAIRLPTYFTIRNDSNPPVDKTLVHTEIPGTTHTVKPGEEYPLRSQAFISLSAGMRTWATVVAEDGKRRPGVDPEPAPVFEPTDSFEGTAVQVTETTEKRVYFTIEGGPVQFVGKERWDKGVTEYVPPATPITHKAALEVALQSVRGLLPADHEAHEIINAALGDTGPVPEPVPEAEPKPEEAVEETVAQEEHSDES